MRLRASVSVLVAGIVSIGCQSATPPVVPTNVPLAAATATPVPVTPTLQATATAVPRATTPPVATSTQSAKPSTAARATTEPVLPGPATQTSSLASRLEAALNSGDVDGAMGLFEPDAQVKVPPDLYVGASQIRNWVSYLAAIHFEIEPGFRNVVGERASWPAEARSDYLVKLGLESVSGMVSIEIKDGLIQNYQYVLSEDSARRRRAAQLAASEVLQDPVIVGQDAANVYGFNDVFYAADGTMVSYRDVLTAEPGSGPYYDVGGQPIVIRSGI